MQVWKYRLANLKTQKTMLTKEKKTKQAFKDLYIGQKVLVLISDVQSAEPNGQCWRNGVVVYKGMVHPSEGGRPYPTVVVKFTRTYYKNAEKPGKPGTVFDKESTEPFYYAHEVRPKPDCDTYTLSYRQKFARATKTTVVEAVMNGNIMEPKRDESGNYVDIDGKVINRDGLQFFSCSATK